MDTDGSTAADIEAIAHEAFSVLRTGRQVPPFSTRYPGFGLADAYRVTPAVRQMRMAAGERPIGRKIGFTNRTIWAEYGVFAPVWGHMYDRTVHELGEVAVGFSLDGLAEPRIEPEIVFGLRSAPEPGLDEAGLLGCIEWVAHGFEIVQSIFLNWSFVAADTVAGYGLHGALLIGPRQPVAGSAGRWLGSLSTFEIELLRNGESIDRGRAANVLDGPLPALRHLVEVLAADSINPPLAAGEIITTGTLTRAFPVAPGEHWETRLKGVALEPIAVRFV